MKYMYFNVLLISGLLLLMSSCTHEHGADTHTHDDGHSHGGAAHVHNSSGLELLSFTLRTKKSELFVEFPPLVVEKLSRFAIHFSEMQNFKAIEEGKIIVRLWAGEQKVAENGAPAPTSPGIFQTSLSPKKAGDYNLQFILLSELFNDTISLEGITVYPTTDAAIAANPPQPEGDEISFLKNQAWKTDFAIEQVQRRAIREVIHTSGEIQPVKADEKIIAAKSSGIVFYKSKNLQEGSTVRAGEALLSISSKGLLQSNVEEKYQVAKARIDKTKANFERAEQLLAQQIIGRKEYEQRKMDYSIAKAEFQTLTNTYQTGGQSITAPIAGIVKNVLVSDGQFVEEGTPLLEITRNRRLLLQAEVSQHHLPKLRSIKTANFKTSYQQEVQSIDDYNGRLISYGKVLEKGSSFIPVLFELDNLHELIPGSFVELFLLTKPLENELVIPKSALLQDYNVKYVYVQTGGERFEKREVKTGVDDGIDVQLLSGVAEGEWVVTKGAYQIKMAAMSSTIPSHGHTH